jgi:hypothetical protein
VFLWADSASAAQAGLDIFGNAKPRLKPRAIFYCWYEDLTTLRIDLRMVAVL